jgi:SNF2 family DNA or RNA helicase
MVDMNLRPYQLEDAKTLAKSKALYYVGDMGIGKTATSLTAAKKTGAQRILVICPAVAMNNWAREVAKWWPEATVEVAQNLGAFRTEAQIHVIGYDAMSRTCDLRGYVMGTKWDLLICDEAHYMKGIGSNRTYMILGPNGLHTRCKQVWLLSGTPMPNNAGDLYPALSALAANSINKMGTNRPMTKEEFEAYFCEYRDTVYGRQVVKSKNLDVLKSRTKGFFLRRRKSEVLKELPPVTVSTVELSGFVPQNVIDQIEEAMAGVVDPLSPVEDIVLALQAETTSLAAVRRLTGLAKANLAAEHIRMRLNGGEPKIVIFAHHHDVIEDLLTHLKDFNPVALSGKTPPKGRDNAIDQFQNNPKCRVFIGQIQAAGTAITLTAGNWVVMAESDWVPANNLQALSRCHRIGQANPVFVEFLALPGSIDYTIQRALARKSADIDYMFA